MINRRDFRLAFAAVILLLIILSPSCKKPRQVLYPFGTFPDTCMNLSGINSQYDDYNMDLEMICNISSAVFSSNRASQGGQFDLVTGLIEYYFDKYTGNFLIESEMINDPYLTGLVTAANTATDDLGPYRMLSREDSHEYLFITTEGSGGDMDIKYMKYLPDIGPAIPDFGSLLPLNVLNSSADDGYISFDVSQERVFFHSDREGQFNIYNTQNISGLSHSEWFAEDPVAVIKIDSINSEYDDKCPLVALNIMVFTSNRPGGLGGYDLYYSIYKDGKWGSPVNFGPTVNSEADEYRPVLGYHPDFTNQFLIFSSDRPGGAGGFDIWFAGIDIPVQPEIIMK
jgi:hypothetical protein